MYAWTLAMDALKHAIDKSSQDDQSWDWRVLGVPDGLGQRVRGWMVLDPSGFKGTYLGHSFPFLGMFVLIILWFDNADSSFLWLHGHRAAVQRPKGVLLPLPPSLPVWSSSQLHPCLHAWVQHFFMYKLFRFSHSTGLLCCHPHTHTKKLALQHLVFKKCSSL